MSRRPLYCAAGDIHGVPSEKPAKVYGVSGQLRGVRVRQEQVPAARALRLRGRVPPRHPRWRGAQHPDQALWRVRILHLHSALVLVVPIAAMDVVTPQFAADIATGDAAGPRVRVGSSGGHVAEYAVRSKAGMQKAIPLGSFGEIGVQAA